MSLESDDSDNGSIDEEQAEKERKELRKQLAYTKNKKADPTEHCEGDTDVEELYNNPIPTQASGMAVADDGREVAAEGKGVADKNNEGSSDKKDNGRLSPPPSDGDGDMLCSEDDDRAVKDVHMKAVKKRRPKKCQVRIWFNVAKMLDPSQFCKGLCFTDMDQVRFALQSYDIVNGRDYRFLRNEPRYVMVRCQSEFCPFYLIASKISKEPTVMIRRLEEPHTCGTTSETSRISSNWVANVFEEQIRSDPDWKVQDLIDEIQRKYGVEITKMMAYRARAKAGEIVLGNHKAQYKRIRDYCQTVIDKNPKSIVRVATINYVDQGLNPRFFGLFMCLKA
uniref:Transposase MuDR plant domain-containing protein n=1 Tax=Arundo donax TaxID=35708 RepID=A0A0A9CVT4_ARUDO